MSTAPNNNGGCGKTLLYLLLGSAGLWIGWHALQWLYYAFSYAGANALLALDLSSYGQLADSYWLGYGVLGLGLGAAGGAIAAQRRFGLARAVAVGGWVAIVLLLGIVYATIETDDSTETSTSIVEPQPVQTPTLSTLAAPAPAPDAERPHRAAAQLDTSSIAAEGWQQVVGSAAPLLAYWPDSLAKPLDYLQEGDTVQLLRRAHAWVQVASIAADRVTSIGWVHLAGLRPLAATDELPTEVPEATVWAAEKTTKATSKTKKSKYNRSVAPDSTAPATPPHPLGHQQHMGQVGDQAVTYALDWQPNGELSGTYYYNQQPNKLYRLTGAMTASGELHLLEMTRGRQSGRCILQRQGDSYIGQMVDTEGNQRSMTLEE
jgi:hypothetical protein